MTTIQTPRRPVEKTIGAISFTDPYDWLHPESEEAQVWQKAQVELAVARARSVPFFDDLVAAITPRIAGHASILGSIVKRGGRWFRTTMNDAGTAQALRVSDSWDDPGRVLVDAAELTATRGDDRPTALIYNQPSPDGSLVVFGSFAGGDGMGSYRVVDVDSGQLLDVEVPASMGNLRFPAWAGDGGGFYLDGRAADGRLQMVFTPIDGRTPEATSFEFSDLDPSTPGLVAQSSPSGDHVLAVTVPHEHTAVMLREPNGTWRRFAPPVLVGELHGGWLDDETYVAIATDSPRGRVVAIPLSTSTEPGTWRELVPPGDLVLRGLRVIDGRIIVTALDDVRLDVRVYDRDGTCIGTAELPEASAALGLVGPGRFAPDSDAMVFEASTFTSTDATYQLDPATAALTLLEPAREVLDGIGVEQHFATSADGTQVPYFVVARTDLDRSVPHPTLVNAYGGFNLPWLPSFLEENSPFVEAGGIYVRASLRGGCEYGREWFEGGTGATKPNVFADLRAVAEDLIERGIATPDTLAFQGASNGGLLAGVAITQQPELWRVVVAGVPSFDLMEPSGDVAGADFVRAFYAQNYGDPQDPDQAPTVFDFSPFHNVRDGVAYPAVFQVFGEKDTGCQPLHGRRFTAALQHATTSGRPVLLRVWPDMSHGTLHAGAAAQQAAEWLAFVMSELGMTYQPE